MTITNASVFLKQSSSEIFVIILFLHGALFVVVRPVYSYTIW